jgi:hypothetical protein
MTAAELARAQADRLGAGLQAWMAAREPGDKCCSEPHCSHQCPRCPFAHELCEFAVGSTRCIKPDCRNPHHRA